MEITVEEALRVGGLGQCKLIAGHGGIGKRITCIDSMEVPDIAPWLHKRELLITTGYSIKNDTGALLRLVRALHGAGAAGLAIKTRFLGNLSRDVIKLADELDMPLIEIPAEMPIVDIIDPLMRAIVDRQNLRLEFSATIHDKFTELELSGGGLGAAAHMLGRLLDMPVAIVDHRFHILEMSGPREEADLLKLRQELEALPWDSIAPGSLHGCCDGEAALAGRPVQLSGQEQRIHGRCARFKNKVSGYILAVGRAAELDEMKMIILDHGVTTVALEFSKMEVLSEHLRTMDNNFFLDIIMHNVKSNAEAQYRAQFLKWPKPPLALVIFDVDHFGPLAETRTELEMLELKQGIQDIIAEVLGKGCTVISKSDSFSCIIPESMGREAMTVAVEQVEQAAKRRLGLELTAGLAGGIQNYIGLGVAHEEARDAIVVARLGSRDKKMVRIEEARLEQALLHSRQNPYMKRYVEDTVEKLAAYDQENKTQLVQTLEALVQNMGIRTQTAEKLFLHRNTLLYRIRKIESLTGYDLSRSEQLFDLGLALKMRKYLYPSGTP